MTIRGGLWRWWRMKNLTDKRFGRLIAKYPTDKRYQKKVIWHCVCDCGNEIDVVSTYLTNGDVKSCGCLYDDTAVSNIRSGYESQRVDGVASQLFADKARKDSSTGYRGVTRYYTRKNKKERYRAWITVKGEKHYKAGFLTAEEAYEARKVLEDKYLPENVSKRVKDKRKASKRAEREKQLQPGNRFEGTRLTIIKEAPRRGSARYFLCQCDCGSEPKEFSLSNIRNGSSQSCGCLRRERNSKKRPKEIVEKMKLSQNKARYNRKLRSDSKTGYKGVSYSKARRAYIAYLYKDGKKYEVGGFETLEEAIQARKELEKKYIK